MPFLAYNIRNYYKYYKKSEQINNIKKWISANTNDIILLNTIFLFK